MESRITHTLLCGFALFGLSACASGAVPSGKTASSVYSTSTRKPTRTVTPTETLLPTLVPINTPTQGPPPDLEVLNLSLSYNENALSYFYGEIRNNTNTTMVFPLETIPILRFAINSWQWNGVNGVYEHYEVGIGKGSTGAGITNCILYPGETGLIRFTASCQEGVGKDCVAEQKIIFEPPAATGMQLVGYQDLKKYIPWPDLPKNYHPQATNINFSYTGSRLDFTFDLQSWVFADPYYNIEAWVVLYDSSNKIVGIVFRAYLNDDVTEAKGDVYHISGFYQPKDNNSPGPTGSLNFFMGDLTEEELSRVDHIGMMVERQHRYLCSYNYYDIYRRYIQDHPE
jgi:hypothetical protein